METNLGKQPEEKMETQEETDALKSALYSSLLFVGGGIVAFIILLLAIYMIRL
ncbi:hypothetical protein [Virgibacillus sp. YIM 98842]|jgi:hypothetical protein|uniref:hypothetical protein n=1 Tax=Virgibacillus sp. YIM 98842 TaxID=2663533 RepID=UPI0013D8E66C|nr:hypothetical protein [Virgibacillus sp. YIM 98842]